MLGKSELRQSFNRITNSQTVTFLLHSIHFMKDSPNIYICLML